MELFLCALVHSYFFHAALHAEMVGTAAAGQEYTDPPAADRAEIPARPGEPSFTVQRAQYYLWLYRYRESAGQGYAGAVLRPPALQSVRGRRRHDRAGAGNDLPPELCGPAEGQEQ